MKIARILLTPVVAVLITASANAQMSGYPGMGGPYGGMPAGYFQPTPAPPMNGAGPMGPGPMAPGPMNISPMDPEQAGPMNAGAMGGDNGQWYGDSGGPVEGGMVGSNPGGRLPLFQRSLFRQRTSRGYFTAEALMWHRNDGFARVINVQTPNRLTTPAGNISKFSQPFMRTSDPYFGYETLPRLTLGYVLPNDLAIEFQTFYKDDFDAKFDSYGNSNLDATFFGQQPLASNYTSADAQFINMATGVHSYELNLVETTRVFNFMTGLRYVDVRDNFLFTTFKNGSADSASIGTYNHMFGVHTGVRSHFDWNLFSLDLGTKVGYFINDAQSRTIITNTGLPGRDPGRLGGQNDSMLAETKLALSFRPSASFNVRVGYDCMWIVNTALAVDQIDENPLLGQNTTGYFLNAKGDLFLHGPSAGLEFAW